MVATHKIPSFSRHWQTNSSGASHVPEQARPKGSKGRTRCPTTDDRTGPSAFLVADRATSEPEELKVWQLGSAGDGDAVAAECVELCVNQVVSVGESWAALAHDDYLSIGCVE